MNGQPIQPVNGVAPAGTLGCIGAEPAEVPGVGGTAGGLPSTSRRAGLTSGTLGVGGNWPVGPAVGRPLVVSAALDLLHRAAGR